jgi:hypothetical protein
MIIYAIPHNNPFAATSTTTTTAVPMISTIATETTATTTITTTTCPPHHEPLNHRVYKQQPSLNTNPSTTNTTTTHPPTPTPQPALPPPPIPQYETLLLKAARSMKPPSPPPTPQHEPLFFKAARSTKPCRRAHHRRATVVQISAVGRTDLHKRDRTLCWPCRPLKATPSRG